MIRVIVGGQMDKQKIAHLIKQEGADAVEVSIGSDIDAAMKVKNGQADYYVGCCATGAGAALAMALAIVGANDCVSLSIPGKIKSTDEIQNAVAQGKKAFGFVNTDAERIVPSLVKALVSK